MSGSGISWAICKSIPRSRQTTTPAPHNSVFYRPDALPVAQPTESKHWRHWSRISSKWLKIQIASQVDPTVRYSNQFMLCIICMQNKKNMKRKYLCHTLTDLWKICHGFSVESLMELLWKICRGFSVESLMEHTHTHPFYGPFSGLPVWASTRKVKPIWISLKQETVSGSGISWAICKSAPRSRQITTPAPHHSVFLQAGCPSCRPTNSIKALKGKGYILLELLWKMFHCFSVESLMKLCCKTL